jgi:hypothetical protein
MSVSPENDGIVPISSGAIYVAEVRASLPDFEDVQGLYYAACEYERRMREMEEHYDIEEQEFSALSRSQVHIEAPDGTPVHTHETERFVISDYRALSGYFLLQSVVLDTGDEFTPLFLNIPDDAEHTGNLGYHVASEGESALFLMPTEACNDGKLLVPSAAFLCVGNQVSTFYNAPPEDQVDALIVAADVLLGRDPTITTAHLL